jgi:hypothetical protein
MSEVRVLQWAFILRTRQKRSLMAAKRIPKLTFSQIDRF